MIDVMTSPPMPTLMICWRVTLKRAEDAEAKLKAIEDILVKRWRKKLVTQTEINHAAIDVAVELDNLFRDPNSTQPPGAAEKT